MKNIFLLVTGYLMVIGNLSTAQINAEYPKIGDHIPEHTFDNVRDFPTGKRSISDFKGKWLIIDFWATSCGGCVASFPKMNKLQHDFKDKLQLLMVGDNAGRQKKTVVSAYELFKNRQKLDFAVAFDSVLFEKFDVGALPHIVVVDPEGIIKGFTTKIDSADIIQLLEGKQPALAPYYGWIHARRPWHNYRRNEPLLTNGNGGNDSSFLYRSLITKWNPTMPLAISSFRKQNVERGIYELTGTTPASLIKMCVIGQTWISFQNTIYGKISKKVIFKNKDSLILGNDNDHNNLYCYSLTVPKYLSNVDYVRKRMKNDLEEFFQISVSLEKVSIKRLNLRVSDMNLIAKRKTDGLNNNFHFTEIGNQYGGYRFRNTSSLQLSDIIANWATHWGYELFEDQTDLSFNLDVDISAFVKDIKEVRKALRKNGLDLVEDKKVVEAIVVRDKN